MIEKAVKQFTQIDLFSQKVELFMKKEKDHRTVFGACSSIGLLFILFYFGIIQLQEMITRSNPNSQTFIYHNPIPGHYYLARSNFTFIFAVESLANFQTFIDPTLFSMHLIAATKQPKTLPDGKVSESFEFKELPIQICSNSLIDQVELRQYMKAFDLSTKYCIDFNAIDNVQLQGAFDSPFYRYLELQVHMCNNDTLKDGQKRCQSQEEIDQSLGNVAISWQFTDISLDLTDPFNAHKIVGKDIYSPCSNKMNKKVDFYMKPLETRTDLGFVTDDIQVESGLQYGNHVEFIQLQPLGTQFFNMQIRLQYDEITNTRKYLKFQDILGTLGGLWQILYFIFFVFVNPINSLSQKLVLLNSLFNFEGQQAEAITQQNESNQNILRQSIIQKHSTFKNYQKKTQPEQKIESLKMIVHSMSHIKKSGQLNRQNSEVGHPQSSIKSSTNRSNQKSIKKISEQIKLYFKRTSRKIVLTCTDYIQIVVTCVKMSNQNMAKMEQIKFSDQRIEKSMDIINIIKKLNEIDKLKVLLLTQDQIRLFDYVEKPTIAIHPNQPIHQKDHQYYWSILKQEKSSYQSAMDAQLAFTKIHREPSSTNTKLIQMLDPNVVSLFQQMQQNLEQPSMEDRYQFIISPSDCEYKFEDDEQYQSVNINITSPKSAADLAVKNSQIVLQSNRGHIDHEIVFNTIKSEE